MNLKKCMNCGALVWILKDCNCDECGIKCCLTEMVNVKANSVDAAIEKHKPVYTIVGDNIEVSVNHVMEEDHYIEWIAVVYGEKVYKQDFKPGDEPKMTVPYEKGIKLYAYCNKHSLWETEVEN